jgi:hypothetical protein
MRTFFKAVQAGRSATPSHPTAAAVSARFSLARGSRSFARLLRQSLYGVTVLGLQVAAHHHDMLNACSAADVTQNRAKDSE